MGIFNIYYVGVREGSFGADAEGYAIFQGFKFIGFVHTNKTNTGYAWDSLQGFNPGNLEDFQDYTENYFDGADYGDRNPYLETFDVGVQHHVSIYNMFLAQEKINLRIAEENAASKASGKRRRR